jgi:hypothetical protein
VRAGYTAVAPPSTALSSSELDEVAVAVADTSKGLHVAKTRDGYEDREGMVQISHFLAYALYLRERERSYETLEVFHSNPNSLSSS